MAAESFKKQLGKYRLKSPLSPVEKGLQQKDVSVQTASSVVGKMSANEIRKMLPKVNKLSDLQKNLKKVSGFKEPSPAKKVRPPPKLTKGSFSLEIVSPSKKPPASSPRKAAAPDPTVKASPRKRLDFDSAAKSAPNQGDRDLLPLPMSYTRLKKTFSSLDSMVATRHNRHQAIPVETFMEEIRRATGVTTKHLKQIR